MTDANLKALLADLPGHDRPDAERRLRYVVERCGWIVLGYADPIAGHRKHADDLLCLKPDGDQAYLTRARELPDDDN